MSVARPRDEPDGTEVNGGNWLWNHIGRITGTVLGLCAFAGVVFLAAIGSKSALGLLIVLFVFFLLIAVGGRIRGR
jgi:hypothetical protein